MHIKVLGTGCKKCEDAVKLVERKVAETGAAAHVEKVTDTATIMEYGVMSTPGFVVDETVVHSGSLPSEKQVTRWLGA